jgi:hypothetical protein
MESNGESGKVTVSGDGDKYGKDHKGALPKRGKIIL